MEITAFDRLKLDASDIYRGLVRLDQFGSYCYYTKPWTEKIHFYLPPDVIEAHNAGNVQSMTLVELENGQWELRRWEKYVYRYLNRKPKEIKYL